MLCSDTLNSIARLVTNKEIVSFLSVDKKNWEMRRFVEFPGRVEYGKFPKYGKIVSLAHFGEKRIGKIPSTVKNLFFSSRDFKISQLPENLETLRISDHSDTFVEIKDLPRTLRVLSIMCGKVFIHNLPPSLESFCIDASWSTGENFVLPETLKNVEASSWIPSPEGILPDGVESVKFKGPKFENPPNLPKNIKSVVLSRDFCHSLDFQNAEKVIFESSCISNPIFHRVKFFKNIHGATESSIPKIFPNTLETLILGGGDLRNIFDIKIPSSVRKIGLTFSPETSVNLFRLKTFIPPSVKELSLSIYRGNFSTNSIPDTIEKFDLRYQGDIVFSRESLKGVRELKIQVLTSIKSSLNLPLGLEKLKIIGGCQNITEESLPDTIKELKIIARGHFDGFKRLPKSLEKLGINFDLPLSSYDLPNLGLLTIYSREFKSYSEIPLGVKTLRIRKCCFGPETKFPKHIKEVEVFGKNQKDIVAYFRVNQDLV